MLVRKRSSALNSNCNKMGKEWSERKRIYGSAARSHRVRFTRGTARFPLTQIIQYQSSHLSLLPFAISSSQNYVQSFHPHFSLFETRSSQQNSGKMADTRIATLTSQVATSSTRDETSDDELFAELEKEIDEDFDMGALREQRLEELRHE